MDRNRHQKTRRVAFNPSHGPTHMDLHNLVNILQEMLDELGYVDSRQRPRASFVKCQTTIPAAPSNPRGALNMRVNSDRKEVPFFKTYEEFHETVVQSCENISIILNTDGKVAFISQNVSSLLGHRPEDIVGKTLLNILLDEEQEEISQKIILNAPLDKSVGSLIEFCCYVRKRTAGLFNQDAYTYVDMYNRRDTYEYVKFVLYLQDSYDDSFVIFGNYGRSSRNTCSSTTRLLREQRYYLVGTILVLRTRAESGQPPTIQPPVIVTDSDDDNNTQSQRLQKRRETEEIQGKHQDENLNTESPVSISDAETVDVIPAPRQIPFELSPVSTPSRSSIYSTISTATSTSMSSSGDFAAIASSLATSKSGQDSMIEAKYRIDPVDMGFDVGPEFLLSDSQEKQTSREYEECSDEDEKKPLEGETGSKPKEHAIDEVTDASLDNDPSEIVEDTEVQKDTKIQELVVDQQGHQKTVETFAKSPSPVAQPMHPEEMVELMVCTDLPTYEIAEEREQEQCIYELAQCIEMLRNLPYERPRAQDQMGQGQENRVYLPQEQVVSLINDLGPRPLNFFGNGNSEYPLNETHRLGNDHVNHTYPVFHDPSTRSYQPTYPVFHDPSTRSYQPTYPVPYQPGAATYQPLAATNQPLTGTHHPPARSQYPSTSLQLSTSDYKRESGPHFLPPRQEHPSYFHPDWYIDPHP